MVESSITIKSLMTLNKTGWPLFNDSYANAKSLGVVQLQNIFRQLLQQYQLHFQSPQNTYICSIVLYTISLEGFLVAMSRSILHYTQTDVKCKPHHIVACHGYTHHFTGGQLVSREVLQQLTSTARHMQGGRACSVKTITTAV